MPKLDIAEMKRYAFKFFSNKAEMLKYIEKVNFKDKTLCISYIKKKWVVRWKI